jgi:hypothetical protein
MASVGRVKLSIEAVSADTHQQVLSNFQRFASCISVSQKLNLRFSCHGSTDRMHEVFVRMRVKNFREVRLHLLLLC